MTKNKAYLAFIVALLLNFNLINIAFAIENVGLKNRYPDYSYEFCGKDTCENFNRKIFIFNSKLNKFIVRPINTVWSSVMPQYGIDRVQNFYTNIKFPIRFVGCLLQKDFKSSRSEALRFLTNTTLGFGGLYDPAQNRFKIESRQEDMAQVLAYHNVKTGPYLVLPIIASGNIRDIAGELLNCPLNPCSYIFGPAAMISTGVSLINKTTALQPLVKAIDTTYADPYDIAKKLCGVDKYIKNSNLDRREVLAEKAASQGIVEINSVDENPDLTIGLKTPMNPDIVLENYNPQCPSVDSLRTAMFDDPKLKDSIWSELSVWNNSFCNQIKTSSVNIDEKHPNYKYRYILQKNKTAPLAILYPSFGEGIMSHHSIVLAKILYDEGYSVVIQGSAFHWEFAKSMPDGYKPGLPSQDADYLRIVTSKILNSLQGKKGCSFTKKILVGTSYGGLTTLFVAAKEEAQNTLGISNYISVNPPVEMIFALTQLDKYSQEWEKNPSGIKLQAAITAEKILMVSQHLADKKSQKPDSGKLVSLPFTDAEAKLIIGFVMKQKLSDLVFTIEKSPTSKKSDIYSTINNMSFYDYTQKYLLFNQYDSLEQLNYNTSLACIAEFLQQNEKYKIYHSLDDYYTNPEQLSWLKRQSSNKAVFFNNGSHLGFLYRKEFLDEFKKDIAIKKTTPLGGI